MIITRPIQATQTCDYCSRPAIAHLWGADQEWITCGGQCPYSLIDAGRALPLAEHVAPESGCDQCSYCHRPAVAMMGRDNDGLGHEPTCGGTCQPSRDAAEIVGWTARELGTTESEQRP